MDNVLLESSNLLLNVALVVPCTEAEGPGRRWALWVQGCPLRCPGCCNPEYLSFTGGAATTLAVLQADILAAKEIHSIEGISLLGGEPFAQADSLAYLAGYARSLDLGVMVYTGYTLAEIQQRNHPGEQALLRNVDLLVDGPYMREQPDSQRRWIGSTNQKIHFLSDRYKPDDPCWTQRDTLEIRLKGKELSVNGFPAAGIKEFWRRAPKPVQ